MRTNQIKKIRKKKKKKRRKKILKASKKSFIIAGLVILLCLTVAFFFPAINGWMVESRAYFGDTRAKFELAEYYYSGSAGFDKDFDKALYWYRKAAEKKHEGALFALGKIFEEGIIVVPDRRRAMSYYLQAANRGERRAQVKVGMMHLGRIKNLGSGEDKAKALNQSDQENLDQALSWLGKAADRDDRAAMARLADLYLAGYGAPEDRKKALPYLLRAAELGDSGAQLRAGLFYLSGENLEKNPERGIKLLEEASIHGNVEALYHLGVVAQDPERARHYLELAAEKGSCPSQELLGRMCEEGLGGSKNIYNAIKWYEHAAENGSVPAMARLGTLYSRDDGELKPDSEKALFYTRAAARAENPEALRNLGLFFRTGFGVFQNQNKALHMFKAAADKGDAQAMYHLGECYEYGYGCFKNMNQAKVWYERARDEGSADASARLQAFETNQF
ncbi:MAG: tetratricopeptide repeat protein [Cyanobacteriota/Melainabacteria group bacterium]